MTMTLMEASGALLSEIVAKDGDSFHEFKPETTFTLSYGDYEYEFPMEVLQDLDRAHEAAFHKSQKSACTRRDRKASGKLL